MKEITLTNSSKTCKISDEDFKRISLYQWALHEINVGYSSGYFYAVTRIDGKIVFMHRYILGCTDKEVYVDHRNNNGLDNRRSNIRTCSNAENQWNTGKSKKPSRSKFKGVSWHKGDQRWHVRISFNGNRIHVGSFEQEIEAAKEYDKNVKKYHGKFAVLNF